MAITVDVANLGTATQDAAATSMSLTTTGTVTSGGFIVLGCGRFGSVSHPTGVSGGGLSWTVEQDQWKAGGPGFTLAWAQAPSGLASNTAITITFPNADGNGYAIGAMSFQGVQTSSPVDGSGMQGAGTFPDTNPWGSGSQTIQAGSALVAVNYTNATGTGNTATAPSIEAWEAVDLIDVYGAAMCYRIETSSGSYAVGGQWQGVGSGGTGWAAFLAAPASQTSQLHYHRTPGHGLW